MMDLSPLECRKVDPSLAGPLAVFFAQLREQGDELVFHPHPLSDREAERIANYNGNDLYYVLVHGARVLAYGMLRGWDQGFQVPSLGVAVLPSLRGQGVGGTLIRFLHLAARLRGARSIRLKVHTSNAVARRAYERLGYQFVGQEGGQLVGVHELTGGCSS